MAYPNPVPIDSLSSIQLTVLSRGIRSPLRHPLILDHLLAIH
jgi:hypothetical protein